MKVGCDGVRAAEMRSVRRGDILPVLTQRLARLIRLLELSKNHRPMAAITILNIQEYRGDLELPEGDFPFQIWDFFDKTVFDGSAGGRLLDISCLVSTKNHLTDPRFVDGTRPDARATAFDRMLAAANGQITKRPPITVHDSGDGQFSVVDGNATVQVLMLLGWQTVPVDVID